MKPSLCTRTPFILAAAAFATLCLVNAAPTRANTGYSENFDAGSATYTVNDPYWLSGPSANGFITKTTNTPTIWPGNPGGFSTDINADVSGTGYFLFEGTDSYPTGPNIPAGNNQFFISPSFAVIPNTFYSVSFYLTNADTNGSALTSVQPELGGSLLGSPVAPVGTWLSNGWQQFSFGWNSGSNTTASLILHDFTQTSSGNDFGIDAILVTTPEPSAISLLLLGATGLLARRRANKA